jgi:nicotinamide-nucleotide amidase
VGLVYVACASPEGIVCKKFNFRGDRAWIRQRSAVLALDLLRQSILRRAR